MAKKINSRTKVGNKTNENKSIFNSSLSFRPNSNVSPRSKSIRIGIRTISVVFVIGIIIGMMIYPEIQLRSPECSPNGNITSLVPLQGLRSASARIVAVSAETGTGVLGTATVEIIPGQGRLLINTNPFIEPDTQASISIAKYVAENVTGVLLANSDIVVSFDLPLGNQTTQLVGGPSAGAALTLAIIAATMNASVRSDVAITGTILPSGRVGNVGGILEKAEASANAGVKLFLVPSGQTNLTYYEKTEERTTRNGFTITRISYEPKALSLNNYTMQWNMTSVEVTTISEAAELAINDLKLPKQ